MYFAGVKDESDHDAFTHTEIVEMVLLIFAVALLMLLVSLQFGTLCVQRRNGKASVPLNNYHTID